MLAVKGPSPADAAGSHRYEADHALHEVSPLIRKEGKWQTGWLISCQASSPGLSPLLSHVDRGGKINLTMDGAVSRCSRWCPWHRNYSISGCVELSFIRGYLDGKNLRLPWKRAAGNLGSALSPGDRSFAARRSDWCGQIAAVRVSRAPHRIRFWLCISHSCILIYKLLFRKKAQQFSADTP